jgi:hypothetical protein
MQESYGRYQIDGLNNYYMKLTEARITELNEWLDGYPEGVIGIGTVKYHYELKSLPVEKYDKQYSNDDMMELGWELLGKEMLGPLRIGMTYQDLSKVLQLPHTKDQMYFCAVDGLDHQIWNYDKIGVQLEMDGKELCEQTIGAVHIKSPSTWTTTRRIGIGSSRIDVIKAYKRSIYTHSDLSASDLIAGSAYGGIQFIFEKDLVKEIFIGILNHD